MDTARLRALGAYPALQSLLQSLLLAQAVLPQQAELVGEDQLSSGLGDALHRVRRDGHAWCAWRHQEELSAVSASLDESSSRAHGRPVLLVLLYDSSGRVMGSSLWLESKPGVWSHCPP